MPTVPSHGPARCSLNSVPGRLCLGIMCLHHKISVSGLLGQDAIDTPHFYFPWGTRVFSSGFFSNLYSWLLKKAFFSTWSFRHVGNVSLSYLFKRMFAFFSLCFYTCFSLIGEES